MSPRDANFNEAAYLVQADTERKQAQNACAKLLELLRQHHADKIYGDEATPKKKKRIVEKNT